MLKQKEKKTAVKIKKPAKKTKKPEKKMEEVKEEKIEKKMEEMIIKEEIKREPAIEEMDDEKMLKIEKSSRYFEATGRRKTSIARVRLFTLGEKEIIVNEKSLKNYFPIIYLQKTVADPLEKLNCSDKFRVVLMVKGGGVSSQAEACRHAISRALVLLNPYFKKRLRKAGFLTRDPRMRERKKFGLKGARRAPQWSKR